MSPTLEMIAGLAGVVLFIACAAGCGLNAFLAIMDFHKRTGKSQLYRVLYAISVIGGLILLPFFYQMLLDGPPPRAAGVRLGVLFVTGYFATFGFPVLIALWKHRHWRKPDSDPPSGEELSMLPSAGRSKWPLMAATVLLLASGIGSIYGGGGTAAGYIVAFVFNPLWWLACYYYQLIGSPVCPHCRRLMPSGVAKAINSPLWCGFCCNYSKKEVS